MKNTLAFGILFLVLLLSLIAIDHSPSNNQLRKIASDSDSWSEEDREFYLNNLIQSHDQLIDYDATESHEIEYEIGQYMFQYVTDPSNDHIMFTSQGKELLARITKLKNWLIAKMILINSNDNERNLSARILEAMARIAPPEIKFVRQEMNNFALHDSFAHIIAMEANKQLSATDYTTIRTPLYDASIETALNNIADFEYYFSDDSRDQINVDGLVKFICTHPQYEVDYCGQEQKLFYRTKIQNHLKPMIANKMPKWGTDQGVIYINKKIDELNSELYKVKLGAPDQDDLLASYTDKYFQASSSGPGLLIMSDPIQYKIGAVRQITTVISKVGSVIYGNSGHLNPHSKIDRFTFKLALLDAKTKIREHMLVMKGHDTKGYFWSFYNEVGNISDKKYAKLSADIMRKMVIYNPIATARVLLSDPKYSMVVRSIINNATSFDEWNEKVNKAYYYSSLVIGLTLTVTGVGASVGGWLLAPAVAGTLASSTAITLGTVATATSIGGIVLGIGDTIYYGAKVIEAKNQQQLIEQSILSGNGDKASMIEARKKLTEFRSAMVMMSVNLGFTAVDIIGMFRAMNLVNSATCAIDDVSDINKVTKTVDQIQNSAESYQKTQYLAKNMGSEKTSRFMGFLARTSDSIREKILLKIADSSLSPSSFKIMAEESLQGIQGAAGCL